MNLWPLRSIFPMLAVLVGLTLQGCASAPQTGVRPEFQSHTLQRIAVVPFYAQANFSLRPDELAELLERSEFAAVASLREFGFEVVPPGEFRAHLDESGAARRFDEGIVLRSELSAYFEPAKSSNGPSLEVVTLAKLQQEGVIQADALLFGEVVYHTETRCHKGSENSKAREALKAPTAAPSTPCVVSHFQAKLVYVATGETMWFNRVLLETYPRDLTPAVGSENMALTVGRTFAGPDGLDDFELPQRAAPAEARVASE